MCQLGAEALSFQSITSDDMSEEVLEEAVIRHGNEKYAVVYLTDVLWYDLSLQKIPGTSRQKSSSPVQISRRCSLDNQIIHE